MISLIDFSQVAISAVMVCEKEIKSSDNKKDLIKHIILNQLLGFKKKFGGQLIVCCDGRNYWRKKEFPYYKGHRKHQKSESTFDWKLIYEVLDEIKVELVDNFPYKVIEVEEAEADDIIATLVQYFDENELTNTGLVEEPQGIVIVSTDGDYQQLQKYPNVKQWGNVAKKFIVCKNPKQHLIEYICSGQTKDNIPSIVNPDQWAKDRSENIPTRGKPLKSSRMLEFYHKGYDACLNEEEQRNWKRNELLLDFDSIPPAIHNKIVSAYINYEVKGSKRKVWDYLQSKRMKMLLGEAGSF